MTTNESAFVKEIFSKVPVVTTTTTPLEYTNLPLKSPNRKTQT